MELFAEGFQWGFAHARGMSVTGFCSLGLPLNTLECPSLLFTNTKLLTLYPPFAGEEREGLPKTDLYTVLLNFKAFLMLNANIQ